MTTVSIAFREIKELCYNTPIMDCRPYIANNNDNDNNDPFADVGRSHAG
jgi:hypothetical protein